MREKVNLPGVDPGDVDLILEGICRRHDSDRRFFLYSKKGGGFVF